jgi:NADPH:quinone reductase-like Zn-dependent oxidoreductase
MNLPSSMRAVLLKAYDGKPENIVVDEVPTPKPGPGQVLVKVFASPINPSDLAFLAGMYGFKKQLPTIPGFEGSGTVVDAGAGFLPGLLKGRRVACAAADPKIPGGMWAEYVVTSAQMCVPLSKRTSFEQGAMMLVNPMSAYAMISIAREGHHRAIVQTAAASALGRMIVRLGRKHGLPVINVVRRPEQVQILREIGAVHILDSSATNFDQDLLELCRRTEATIGLDAVAGDLTARIMRAQPKGSRMLVYGALSMKATEVDPGLVIFEGKKLEGFWVSGWLARKNLLSRVKVARDVQNMLGNELKSEVQGKVPIANAAEALRQYMTNMTGGKVLLTP